MIADPYATHDLPRRLSQLARALDLAEGRLAPEVVQPGRELLQQRGVRGSSSLALTTACLIGRATDGKWELLESLAQMPQDFPVEIVDPDAPVACLWRPVAASGLLDAFRVPEGNVLRLPSGGRSAKSPAEYCGDLMLVDVPPGFDPPPPPTEIDPLARVIDLLVWVVQHERMSAAERTRSLDSVASHAEVAVVVVNEAHRFRPDTLRARLGALRAALVGVGAREVPVLAVSAQTGQGIDVLGAPYGPAGTVRSAWPEM